jgi:hypothetical protein
MNISTLHFTQEVTIKRILTVASYFSSCQYRQKIKDHNLDLYLDMRKTGEYFDSNKTEAVNTDYMRDIKWALSIFIYMYSTHAVSVQLHCTIFLPEVKVTVYINEHLTIIVFRKNTDPITRKLSFAIFLRFASDKNKCLCIQLLTQRNNLHRPVIVYIYTHLWCSNNRNFHKNVINADLKCEKTKYKMLIVLLKLTNVC